MHIHTRTCNIDLFQKTGNHHQSGGGKSARHYAHMNTYIHTCTHTHIQEPIPKQQHTASPHQSGGTRKSSSARQRVCEIQRATERSYAHARWDHTSCENSYEYVCIYVCMYVWAYAHARWDHTPGKHLCVCMYAFMHVCMHVCMYVCACSLRPHPW